MFDPLMIVLIALTGFALLLVVKAYQLVKSEHGAITSCPVCHRSVSTNANRCLTCGEPIGGIMTAVRKPVSVASVVVLFIVISGVLAMMAMSTLGL